MLILSEGNQESSAVVDVTFPLLHRGLWVRIGRKACLPAYCQMQLDVGGHPGIFGILHSTY